MRIEKKKNTIYKRSNPEDGDVRIPSQHIEEQKSTISNTTRTSGMTNTSKLTSKTQTSLNKSGKISSIKKF